MSGARRSVVILLVLALVTPLVRADGFLFPAVIPKAFYFQSVVGLALLATAATWLGAGDDGDRDLRLGLARDPVVYALLALVAVALLSAVLGDASSRSLLGSLERRWGVLGWALFLAFYLLLRVHVDREGWRRALRVTVLVAAAAAVWGIVQHHGLLVEFRPEGLRWRRISSTLGNPGYLAAYLALSLTATAYLGWSEARRVPRTLYGLAGGVQVYAFLLTGTRSVVLGAGVGIVTVVAVCLLFARDRWVRFAAGGSLLLLALAAAALWLPPSGGAVQGWTDRLGDVSTRTSSVRFRFAVWDAAMAGLREYPVLGVGPENFHLVWNRHFEPVMYNLSPGNASVDRAHNSLLGAGATMGVPGLLAYAAVWCSVFWSLLQSWRHGRFSGVETAIFAVGFVTYLVHLLIWFEDYGSFVVFLALAGFVAHAATSTRGGSADDFDSSGGSSGSPRPLSIPVRSVTALVALALVALTAWHNARVLSAARAAWQGEYAEDAWEGAERYGSALAMDLPGPGPLMHAYLRRLRFLSQFGDSGSPEGPSTLMNRVLAVADRALDDWEARDPLNPRLYAQRASLCGIRHDVAGDGAGEGCVARNLRRAIDLAPRRIRYRHRLASHHMVTGRPDSALAVVDEALEVYDSFGETYYLRSRVYWKTGERKEAVRQAGFALDLGYGDQAGHFLVELADWLEQEGRHGEAADLLAAQLRLHYVELRRPEVEVPADAGLRPWDRPLASRVPLLYLRAAQPDSAIRFAHFLARRLPDDRHDVGVSDDARIREFVRDVEAGRRARWRGVEGVLAEASDAGAPSDDAGTSAPSTSGVRPDDTGVTPGPEPAANGSDTKRPGAAPGSGSVGHGNDGAHAPRAAPGRRGPGHRDPDRGAGHATVSGGDRPAASRVGL